MSTIPRQSRAFRRLFEEHAPFVWRVLRRHGVPERELEDACQEVFVVLYRRAAEFEGQCELRTWLYGIAFRVAANLRRRAHVWREQATERLPEVSAPASQVHAVERHQARAVLRRAVERLPEAKREVFVLFELEEMSMAQVAQAVGCSINTAYARLYSARRAVAAHVRRATVVGEAQASSPLGGPVWEESGA